MTVQTQSQAKERKVAAVVVTYNRLALLKECIAHLQQEDLPLSHLIVVDNASDADTQDYLESLGDQIVYLRLPENIGGAGGFNRGVRYFIEETQDDFVWLMDDDTMVQRDSLTELINFAQQKPDFGFLASDVRWTDGHRAKMNAPAPMNRLQKVPEEGAQPVQLQSATFVAILFRRTVVEKIGLPITDFFIWGDDIEYSERAGRIAPGYFVPAARVLHKMKANTGSSILKDGPDRIQRYFYAYRNKMYYLKKRDWYRRYRARLRISLEYWQLFFSKADHRAEKLATMRKAIRAGRHFHPKIEYANHYNSKDGK
ncbi:glycosyltransferase family 2 protein [Eupransor demetentiae]|uniref:GT2 family (WcaE) n=1 Tax=Eupransor demetentiae TaxID=3109584 RepID=A0ABM9N3F4_9LACO|nr:GT2 family (WcaE) [Lactobacillaceae bacterium LMG 33000]